MTFDIIMTICGAAIVILTTILACILLIWGIAALVCGLINYLKEAKRENTFFNYQDNDGAF